MHYQDHRLVRLRIGEEIERVVGQASAGSGFLRAGEHAYRILKANPNSGLSGEAVVNEIIATAVAAGVAVELSRPPIAA